MNIPSWPQAGEREAELLHMVLESPQWGGFHPFVAEFEQSFAAYQNALYGISAFNGTVTLELALTALGIGPGDEVIVPAISFISSATAISRTGAIPVFVDIEPWSFNINPNCVRQAVSPKTRAIMAVHFGGTMCDIDSLAAICREYDLSLLEDAAHAHGSEWNGKRAGSFGIAGSFSFQNGKVLSAGEGGILVTSDTDFAGHARSIANHGRIPGQSFYEHYRLGTNFRITGFQAAVLLAQLERLPEQIHHRERNVTLLKNLSAGTPGIVWQTQPSAVTRNSWYLLLGRLRNTQVTRDEFSDRLRAAGVPCAPFYPHVLYRNPLYSGRSCRVTPCPVAEASIQDAFWLPHRLLLADEETIRQTAGLISNALNKIREEPKAPLEATSAVR
ncbi:MAG: DegT/DnrJ/EryC1/StrS family aminotransferase [Acidobacteriaceae bacterium]|nr:DegT/DnrJ/EryC1/StrS family aminotransferase [Acidobacteriaceae bacterium]